MDAARRLPLPKRLRYYIRLRECGFKIHEIQEITGLSEARLIELEKIRKRPLIRDAVLNGLIGIGEALKALKLSDEEAEKLIYGPSIDVKEILKEGGDDEAIAKAIASRLTYYRRKPRGRRGRGSGDPLHEAIKSELRAIFGTQKKTYRLTEKIYEIASKAGLSPEEAAEIIRHVWQVRDERPKRIIAWVEERIREWVKGREREDGYSREA